MDLFYQAGQHAWLDASENAGFLSRRLICLSHPQTLFINSNLYGILFSLLLFVSVSQVVTFHKSYGLADL